MSSLNNALALKPESLHAAYGCGGLMAVTKD